MAIDSAKIIEFLATDLNIEETIEPETELFSSGLLDSVAMMNLITFIEQQARIEVHPNDVTLENFDSVQRITDYVASCD